jgi:hypothetical protein
MRFFYDNLHNIFVGRRVVCGSFVTSNNICAHLSKKSDIVVEFFSNVPNFEVIPIDYNYSEITHIEKMRKFGMLK